MLATGDTHTTMAPKFILWWTLANVVSFGAAAAPMFHNFETHMPTVTVLGTFDPSAAVAGAIAGAVPMALAGYWQRALLRRFLPVSRWWILTLSGGMALNHFVSDGFPDATDPLFALLATGAVVGLGVAPKEIVCGLTR